MYPMLYLFIVEGEYMVSLECLKQESCIVITPSPYKMALLKELSKDTSFYHIQFLTLSELRKLLFYEYHEEALLSLCKEFDLIPENGKVLLEAMYSITAKEQDSGLYQKKKWLEEQGLIIYHPAFLEQLKRSHVFIYGYEDYEMKPFLFFLNIYTGVEYLTETKEKFLPKVTEYDTLEEEVVGTAEKISCLLKEGISINQIFLGSLNSDYKSVVSKIFHQFHIPIQLCNTHFLFEYQIVQDFLKMILYEKSLDVLPELLSELENRYPKTNSFYAEIYEILISIFNKYYVKSRTFSELKDMIIYELKNTSVKKENYQDVVKEVDFETTVFEENDYIFLMGVNLGEFPHVYEDIEYFSDDQKMLLALPTSLEKTIGEEQKIVKKIESLPHMFLSFKKKSPFKEYLKSTFLEHYQIEKGKYHYTNQNYNTYLLNSSLDEFVNFNHKTENLISRYGLETIHYGSYDNQFTGIRQSLFEKYVPYVVLSYTSMQKFFECPFKYYIGSILKIVPPFEETISLKIGNMFHAILEKYFRNDKPLDDIIQEELKQVEILPLEKRNFYLKKYELEIRKLIEIMDTQLAHSEFKPTHFEEKIEWTEGKNITFKIFGKLDKIMTVDDGVHSYVIVIDYKTGFATSDLSKVVYGMNMQLLLYLYFISKEKRFQNYKLGGAYIESIAPTLPNYVEGKTLEDLLWEQTKLDGISLKRTEFISRLDTHYGISSYVKGIRVKKDGEFYASNRLLEEETLKELLKIVEQNITIVEKAIETADFKIAPKKFSSEFKDQISSCSYCPYRDICYLKPKNVVRLKEYKDLEFLGGEKDDTSKTN